MIISEIVMQFCDSPLEAVAILGQAVTFIAAEGGRSGRAGDPMTPDQYRREGAEAMRNAAADHCWSKRDLLADAEKRQIDVGLSGRDYYGRRLEAELLSMSIRAIDVDKVMSGLRPTHDAVARLVEAARTEAEKAMRKFPQPNYVISKVAEEAGEVVKAAIHCAEGREKPENVRAEIVQAMAMLIRLYLEGDQVHGLPALAAIETDHDHA